MKKIFTLMKIVPILVLMSLVGVKAQAPIVIGTGTGTTAHPFNTYWHDNRTQLLFLGAEFGGNGAGLITKIGFNFSSLNAQSQAMGGFTIKMQQTTATSLTGFVGTGWTTVYGPTSFTPTATGWYDFTLTAPGFMANGTNLLIEICFDNTSYTASNMVFATAAAGLCWQYNTDGSTGCTMTGGSNVDRPNTRFTIQAGVLSVFPADGQILQLGSIYNSALTYPQVFPGFSLNIVPTTPSRNVTYNIAGPGAPTDFGYQVIYTGYAPATTNTFWTLNTTMNNTTQRYSAATGIAAAANGGLDLLTHQEQIQPGQYTVSAATYVGTDATPQMTKTSQFNIALQRDIAISEIVSPLYDEKYSTLTGSVGSRIKVKNIGVEAVHSFDALARYYKFNINNVPILVATDTVRWRVSPTLLPLNTGDAANVYFNDFEFPSFGDYKVEYSVTYVDLITPTKTDLYLPNNIYPRAGAPDYIFHVANSVELAVLNIIRPTKTGDYYIGVPFRPTASYFNSGITDTTNVTAYVTIKKLDAFGNPEFPPVYSNETVVTEIGSGDFGIGIFPTFTPVAEGTYIVETSIFANDPSPWNNTKLDTFYVKGQLSGIYTIGNRFVTSARNYPTFKAAENDLFLRGISGNVTFQLTDPSYTIGDANSKDMGSILNPAIDLSGTIIGSKDVNTGMERTIRFEPYPDMADQRSSIVINIQSGIGFYIAQNNNPSNPNSAIYKVNPSEIRYFANAYGKFQFDGGSNKSIRFNMNTNSNLRIPIYLGTGVSNSLITNCIFTDNSTVTTTAAGLPLVSFKNGVFEFQDDSRANNSASANYSSAIVVRSVMPIDRKALNNIHNLDSLSNQGNIISFNEMSGFSYGIVSLGTGMLFNYNQGKLQNFYNRNNTFKNNKLFDLKRAGIVMGFEDGSIANNNVIYNVNGLSTISDAAGIILGGEGREGFGGYNNMNVELSKNEITNINGTDAVYGIKYEQFFTEYSTFGEAHPQQNENSRIINNMIWGIKAQNANTHKFGIRAYSSRSDKAGLTAYEAFLTPYNKRYKIYNTAIINNTVVIDEDATPFNNTGVIAGIALQNVMNSELKNNAIAIKDLTIAPECQVMACVVLQSELPKQSFYVSDRNAYEVNNVGSVYRLIEMNKKDTIIEVGDKYDYKSIFQWQNWTSQDMNSKFGNFTSEMITSNAKGYPTYRVKLLPETPISSILNDNGYIMFNYLGTDIDSVTRGRASNRFDIGACEFDGRYYNDDLSIENITEPRKYQTGSGKFSDAEYVMQTPPYIAKAVIKNNGTISKTDVPVRLIVSIESPVAGVFTPIDTLVLNTNVSAAEYRTVTYNLPSSGNVLFPRTYQQLNRAGAGYTVPAHFEGMKEQVTPRYKFTVRSMLFDSKPDNDLFEKYVRYYVPQSKISMLVTGENMAADLTNVTDVDIIAGRLNSDSLKSNMARVGWNEQVDSTFNYDVFDRNGWEHRNVNYSIYRTMFWADGNDKVLTRYQTKSLTEFLTTQYYGTKRNLIIGSQEMVRELMNTNSLSYDSVFAVDYLKARVGNPVTPLINGTNWLPYNGSQNVLGRGLAAGLKETIASTAKTHDAPAYPGNLKVASGSDIVTMPAYTFLQKSVGAQDSVMGIVSVSPTRNLVFLSVDWRHWNTSTRVLKAAYDFIERNGGTFVPVELADFDALKLNDRVELSWSTLYELNSDRFEVERAARSMAGENNFETISTVEASNVSSAITEYGPIKDYNVQSGNTYIYRLKMIDKDGSYSYSQELNVTYDYTRLEFTKVTPNPVSNSAIVTYVVPQQSNLEITMYDANGVAVKSLFSGISPAGAMSINFDSAGLPSGAYTLIMSDGTTVATQQIRIQK